MPTSKAISASKFLGKDRYEYYLNELLTEQTIGGQKLSKVEIKEAFSKRKNKISFERFVDKVISTKTAKVAVASPGTTSSSAGNGGGVRRGALVKTSSGSIQRYDGVASKYQKSGSIEQSLAIISKSMSSIAEILAGQKKLKDDTAAYDKRKEEQEKRQLAESKLEKRFEGLKKVAEKVIAPVKSILDRIIDFLTTILLGRVVFKLIEWWGDPKNADKVRSIIRFLGDHWPKLLALYLTFGTSLGRFALGLTRTVARGAVKLLAKIAMLAAAKKMRGARGVAKFLGGGKGRLAANVVGTGIALGGAYAVTQGLKGDGGEENQKTQAYRGGGYVKPKFPTFSGGGLNFSGMMGGASLGAMLGPLGMLLGGAFGSGKPQQMISGFVSGEKGVDKVPAMLSDGEFVMSRGAVAKYGVDTLEAMNAAGGGNNRPKIVGGSTYAQGGGYIGKSFDLKEKPPENTFRPKVDTDNIKSNLPITKDPLDAVRRFIEYKFGVNLNNKSSWGTKASQSSSSTPKPSTGSLLSDPVGAVARIASNMGIKAPNASSQQPQSTRKSSESQNAFSRAINAVQQKFGGTKKPGENKTDQKNMFQEIGEKLQGPGAATYRDAGSIYAKQMLGGFGGPVSERDLSKDSQQELQKAIQRAKKRTGFQISRVESEISKLKSMGAKDGNPALERQKSFLKKLKSGGIRVEYADYADEKGNMSESAKNSKNILGQFWAYERDKKKGGGYRIEDKYDFDAFKKKVKDPKTGKMVERDLDAGELIRDVILGKGKTPQQILQAAYLLNPLRGKGDVDMVLGGRRTAAESMGLSGSKTLLGGLLGVSGKPKDKNTQALEAKRPWWDKAGWFGGGSRVSKEQMKQAQLAKRKPSVKPVRPLSSPKPKVVYGPPVPSTSGRKGGQRSGRTRTPNFGATCPAAKNTKAKTLGVRK